MEYEQFGPDEQMRVLEQKLKTYEVRHFEASLNLKVGIEAKGDPIELDLYRQSVADMETCMSIVREQLAAYR